MTEEKKAISFVAVCLVVIAAGLFFLRDRTPPAVEIEEKLDAIQASIETWHAEKGAPPETLEQLGLPEEAIKDIALEVFQYSVGDDGTVTLRTYGADGKPGGKMFRADVERIFKLGGGTATTQASETEG